MPQHTLELVSYTERMQAEEGRGGELGGGEGRVIEMRGGEEGEGREGRGRRDSRGTGEGRKTG